MEKDIIKKNFIWNTLGVFTLSLTSFVYSLIILRLCNLSYTGIWSYSFAIACTAVTLASFGGRTYQVTDVKNQIPIYVYISSRYFTVLLSFLLIIIFLILKDFNLKKSLIIILLCLFKFCEELSDVYYGIIQKNDDLYIVGKSMFLKSIFNMLVFFIAVYITRDLLLPIILIFIINFLFIYFYDRKKAIKYGKIEKIIDKHFYIKYFKDNLIICLFLFLSTYLVNCPKYVMQEFLSDELQGIYNVIFLPATAVSLIGSFIINPILVNVSKEYSNKNYNKIKKMSNKIVIILIIIGLLICIFGYILSPVLYKLIYNFEIKRYMLEFILTIIGCTFYTISSVISMLLITVRKLKTQLILNILLAVLSTILCILLIKKYSIMGGIFAYLIIMFIRCFIYVILINILSGGHYEKKSITSFG